jgi:sulfoxide reductase heme-binding subunit YedZ
MNLLKRSLNNHLLFWVLLSLPALPMISGLASDRVTADVLLHPSGEFAARLMIVAMAITPLRMLFPKAAWLLWLARRRRAIGVAAFGYAALHTLLYVLDMETLRNILAEFWALSIWTGWAAFAIFIPLAITSNDAAQRKLGKYWRTLHRWVYLAAVLTLVHWMFIQNDLVPALAHFLPLAALETYRIAKSLTSRHKTAVV